MCKRSEQKSCIEGGITLMNILSNTSLKVDMNSRMIWAHSHRNMQNFKNSQRLLRLSFGLNDLST